MSASDVVRSLDYFMSEEHADEFGKLTEAQQATLYQNGSLPVEGDTTTKVAEIIDPPADEQKEVAQTAVAEEAVVLTKDGKHTIPFSELESARERARHFEQMATEQKALLDDLAKAKEQDAGTGGTEAQQAVLAEYVGDFPEVAKDMKPYIEAMIAAGVTAGLAEIKGTLDKVVAPLKQAEQNTEINGHFNAIRDVHKDFDTLVQGDALDKWVETQPSFTQPALREVLEKGNATQIIELVTAYKKDAGEPVVTAEPPADHPAKHDVKQVAADAIAKAKQVGAPKSLSDFPASGVAATSEAEMLLNAGPNELSLKFEGKSNEQIMQMLARTI